MKFDCILLAAGLSSRMSQWKLLREFNGRSIIQHSLDNASSHCGRIIISGGYRIDDLRNHLIKTEKTIIIENPDYQMGMMTSIKAALPYVESDSFFVALGDLPLIPSEIYNIMSNKNFEDVLFPVYKGKRGHPVLIKSHKIDAIIQSDDRGRMKDFLLSFKPTEIEVNTAGIWQDIDTDTDYNRLIEHYIN